MSRNSGELFEFGPFVLDPAKQQLFRAGEAVPLTPKTFDLLRVLVVNRDRTVSKDELIKTVWPDTVVEESNLTQQISAVRKALGESAGGVGGPGFDLLCPHAFEATWNGGPGVTGDGLLARSMLSSGPTKPASCALRREP